MDAQPSRLLNCSWLPHEQRWRDEFMMVRASTLGLIIGLVLGYFWLTRGFDFMVVLALIALIGWLIGKFIGGEIDVNLVRQIFNRR